MEPIGNSLGVASFTSGTSTSALMVSSAGEDNYIDIVGWAGQSDSNNTVMCDIIENDSTASSLLFSIAVNKKETSVTMFQ